MAACSVTVAVIIFCFVVVTEAGPNGRGKQCPVSFSDQYGVIRVAFSAYRDSSLARMSPHQRIIFDKLLINDGDAYDNVTGVFVAPVRGAYFLTWNTANIAPDRTLVTAITVNDILMVHAAAMAPQGQFHMAGNTVILRLNRGDRVAIVAELGDHLFSNEASRWYYPTFTGHLLYKV